MSAVADSGLMQCAIAQAKEELVAECFERGTVVRDHWHEYVAEHGVTNAKSFVDLLERIGSETFTDRVHVIHEFLSSGGAAA